MKNLKTTIYLLASLLIGLTGVSQNEGVSIKTSGGAPDQSAMLDVVHPSKGLLIPRVNLVTTTNSTSPVSNPADGLLVFNLTSTVSTGRGFHYWDQPTSAWTRLTTGSNLWSLIGTTSHIHYTNGNVRIGTASTVSPTYVLEVKNTAATNTFTALFEGRQGQLKFGFQDPVTYSAFNYANYLSQMSSVYTTTAGTRYRAMCFSQVHGDGFRGVEITSWMHPTNFSYPDWATINANRNNLFISCDAGSNVVVSSGSGSTMLNNAGVWVGYSDSTMKKNITTMGSVLANVLALRPVTYKWKTDTAGVVYDGLIAQEVAVQFPRLVSDFSMPTNLGQEEPVSVTKKTLNTTNLVPILIKAIQEQQVIIDDLKTRLHALDGK